MDYLKARTFEVFRYILPGVMFQGVAVLTFMSTNEFVDVILLSKDCPLGVGFLVLMMAYIFGIFLDETNYRLLKVISYNKEKRDDVSASELSTSEKSHC